jgi:hypothetical protein
MDFAKLADSAVSLLASAFATRVAKPLTDETVWRKSLTALLSTRWITRPLTCTAFLTPSEHHCTPIHNDIRPIDIPPGIAHKRNQRTRQFPWMPHPPHWIPTIPRIPRPLQPIALVQNRIHIPRTQTVDPNPITTPLGRQTLRKRQQRRLGRIIRTLRLREVGVVRRYRRRKHNASPRILRTQLARDGLRAQKRASQIDLVCAAPFVGGHFERVRAADDARETAQHVDAAEHFGRTLTLLSTADAMPFSSRTSTASVMMRRSGNCACSALTDSKAESGLTSQRAMPEAPCSRSALAASRARVPAPPVTIGACVSI